MVKTYEELRAFILKEYEGFIQKFPPEDERYVFEDIDDWLEDLRIFGATTFKWNGSWIYIDGLFGRGMNYGPKILKTNQGTIYCVFKYNDKGEVIDIIGLYTLDKICDQLMLEGKSFRERYNEIEFYWWN